MTRRLDITRDVCPMTTVKLGMALARLGAKESLEVRVREEALRNVALSLKTDGHRIASARLVEEGYVLLVEKGGAAEPRQ